MCCVLLWAGAVHLAGRVSCCQRASRAGVHRGELVQSRPAVSGATGGGYCSRWCTRLFPSRISHFQPCLCTTRSRFCFNLHRELCHRQPFWVQRSHGGTPPPPDSFLLGQCKEFQRNDWMVLDLVNVAFNFVVLLSVAQGMLSCDSCRHTWFARNSWP